MRKALILTIVVVAALMLVPLSSASVINATINTKTNVGYVNATSNYVLYYTYPSNSSTSSALNGTVIWMNATSYLNSSGIQALDQNINGDGNQNDNHHHDQMPDQNDSNDTNGSSNSTGSTDISNNSTSNSTGNMTMPSVHVVNATLKYQLHVFASSTNLTIFRNLTLNLRISNITKKVGNNTTVIDMSWRAFRVQGELMGQFRGELEMMIPQINLSLRESVNSNMDVNLLGDIGDFGEGGNGYSYFHLGGLLSNDGFNTRVMNYPTIDFNVFSVPLQQWTRVFHGSSNSTTFYYNASSNYSLNSTVSYNGSNYTLKLRTDPSAAITTNGNAVATNSNELSVTNAPPQSTLFSQSYALLITGIVVIVALALSAVFLRKKSIKK
ncbi:MAG: hypothetical protein M1290_03330 [Candidatus Thermoplasmatota archaeon]|jgi:hypothetical protein|nr:hypothetical protein [Candidatus Thermoplasmatota archaeon]MCL5789479.1 hypothetical protein [Candidatus Thermoplasmatota archaeon]